MIVASPFGSRGGKAVLCLAFVGGVATGCSRSSPSREEEGPTRTPREVASLPLGTSSTPKPSVAAPRVLEPKTPEDVLAAWTEGLNRRDFALLERLYGDRLNFYGSERTRTQVVDAKREALAKNESFRQEVLGRPRGKERGSNVRISFHKRSGPPNAPSDVQAFLVVSKDSLQILEEGDAASEKRFGSRQQLPAPTDCSGAIWQLVDSTTEATTLYADIRSNLSALSPDDYRPGGMGPFTPEENGEPMYSCAIGVHTDERFEAYAWFEVHLDGSVIVDSMGHDWFQHRATVPPANVGDFLRLCRSKP